MPNYNEPQIVQQPKRIHPDMVVTPRKVYYVRVASGALTYPTPDGWTLSNPAAGTWDIAYNQKTTPVSITGTAENSGRYTLTVTPGFDETGVRIMTWNSAGGNSDTDFMCTIVI